MICLILKPSQSFFVSWIQNKEKFIFTEKELFKEKAEQRIEQKNEKAAF